MLSVERINYNFKKVKNDVKTDSKINEMLLNKCVDAIDEILSDGKNYHADLLSAIYMGLLYVDEANDFFNNNLNKSSKEYIKYDVNELIKEELRSVWSSRSNDNKIDKDVARKNYPIPIIDKVDENGERQIISLPGGCLDFHKTMISKENIGLFDNQTKGESYAKYSFPKAYAIYERLKTASVENMLLMEYALGMGYVNQAYIHVKEIQKYSDLLKVCEFIRKGVVITPFFIRKNVMEILWKYLEHDLLNVEEIRNVCVIIEAAQKIIDAVFNKTIELWWYAYYLKKVDVDIYVLQLYLKECWKCYFDNQCAFQDWIEYCGIYDWSKVKSVEDCFAKIIDGSESVNSWLYKCRFDIEDLCGNKYSLLIENPINVIGQDIIEKCSERFKKTIVFNGEEDLRQMFYVIRAELFDTFRKEQENEFYKKDVKVREGMKSIKISHIYAILTQNVMECLLQEGSSRS